MPLDLFSSLNKSSPHENEIGTKISQSRSGIMTTLLNYGFTATSKSRSQAIASAASAENNARDNSVPDAAAHLQKPKTEPLPPIPTMAPLSIPQLEDGSLGRLLRQAPTPLSIPRAAAQRSLRRPPKPLLDQTSRTALPQLPDENTLPCSESKPQLTATLFPPPRRSATPPRRSPNSHRRQSKSSRVQEILKARQIQQLAVPQDPRNAMTNVTRRNSITMTPISAYAGKDQNGPSLSLQTDMRSTPWEQEMALTPIEMDLVALEVIASLPETARPTRKQTLAKVPLRKKSVFRPGSRRSVVAVELPGGSLMTVITPEQSAWQRAPYVPGAVRLEQKAKTERSPLAIIQETVDAELGLDGERLAAEQAILDELVSFIDSFGEDFQVHESGMDAFWIDKPPTRSSQISHRSLFTSSSMAPTLVQSPPLGMSRLSDSDLGLADPVLVGFSDHEEPDFIRDQTVAFKRASFTSSLYSGSSRMAVSMSNSFPKHSPPPVKHPYGSPSSSPGLHPMGATMSNPRRVRQVKGKGGPSSSGQKMSLRGLLRSAASIV